MSDNMELNSAMATGISKDLVYPDEASPIRDWKGEKEESIRLKKVVQWTTDDDNRFMPAARTCGMLTPGYYEINESPNIGVYFQKLAVKTEGLLRFPQANSDNVVGEIQKFWERELFFKKYNLIHKRGILLWGPPGSGKSCTIRLIVEDVISRNGIAINFTNPVLFLEGMRLFRDIQPKSPVVVLMEDMDEIIRRFNESTVLNILDGVELLDKTVFLGTTNYPEDLGPRIVNRPSRFDKRFKIGHPNEESRMLYFKHIFKGYEEKSKYDLEKWVKDTDGMSLAHLKELFVAVVILEDNYEDAIETLQSMKDIVCSSQDNNNHIGYADLAKRNRR